MAGIGLPGNAFVPLIVGFGCNVPAVMAARTMHQGIGSTVNHCHGALHVLRARAHCVCVVCRSLLPLPTGKMWCFCCICSGLWSRYFRAGYSGVKCSLPRLRPPSLRCPLTICQSGATFSPPPGTDWRIHDPSGKTIVLVVTLLSFLNSIGTDGGFGNENSDKSILSKLARSSPDFHADWHRGT